MMAGEGDKSNRALRAAKPSRESGENTGRHDDDAAAASAFVAMSIEMTQYNSEH